MIPPSALQVHTVTQGQTEAMHNSVGLAHYSSASGSNSPAVVLTLPSADGERVLSDQLLETWMLLEFCDQGNLESAAREARFKNDFVSRLSHLVFDMQNHLLKCPSFFSSVACMAFATLSAEGLH